MSRHYRAGLRNSQPQSDMDERPAGAHPDRPERGALPNFLTASRGAQFGHSLTRQVLKQMLIHADSFPS